MGSPAGRDGLTPLVVGVAKERDGESGQGGLEGVLGVGWQVEMLIPCCEAAGHSPWMRRWTAGRQPIDDRQSLSSASLALAGGSDRVWPWWPRWRLNMVSSLGETGQ